MIRAWGTDPLAASSRFRSAWARARSWVVLNRLAWAWWSGSLVGSRVNSRSPGRTASPGAWATRATFPATGATTLRSLRPGRSTTVAGTSMVFQTVWAFNWVAVSPRLVRAWSVTITFSRGVAASPGAWAGSVGAAG